MSDRNGREVDLKFVNEQLRQRVAALETAVSQHQQAFATQQQSEQKYRQIVENAQEGIWLIDNEAHTTFVNPSMAAMLGYTMDEMMGRHLFSFMDERGVALATRYLERRQQGIGEQHDFEFMRKDGRRVTTTIETTPIIGADGSYEGSIAGVIDITARKQAEEERRHSEALLNTIYQNSDVGMFIVAVQSPGVYIYESVNRTHERLFGIKNEEIVGKSPLDLKAAYGQEAVDYIDQIYNECVSTKTPHESEFEVAMPNGEKEWWLSRLIPLEDENGRVYRIIGSAIYINDRKQAEAALRDSEERFRSLSEAAFEAIFISEKGVCLELNRAAEKMFGFTPAEAVGRPGTEWVVPEDRELVMNNVRSGYEEPYEVTALRKDGSTFHAEIRGRMMHYKGHEVRVSALRDISDRKQAEAELHEQGMFLQTIFDNSINAIMVADDAGNYISVNQAAADMFGYAVEKLLHMNVGDLHTSTTPDAAERYRQYLERGREIGEFDFVRQDGESRIAQYHAVRIDTDFNLSILVDITDRKRVEEDLRQSEKRLSVVFNNSTDLQVLWRVESDDVLRIIAVNKPYIETARSFGIDISEVLLVGKTMDEFHSLFGIGAEVAAYTDKNYLQAMITGESVLYTESVPLNWGAYHAEITLIPVLDQYEKCQYVLYNSHNITELKQATEALKELNEQLDERVREQTADLRMTVQAMAGREVRMAELKKVIKTLRQQLMEAGIQPAADDPLVGS